MRLATDICGIALESPLVLASGVLGVTASSMKRVIENGAGAVTMKSLGPVERKGHPNPVMITWEAGMMNAVGLSNPGVVTGNLEIKRFIEISDAPLIASIFAFKKEDFKKTAKIVTEANPHLLEVNISCPNVESEAGTPFALDVAAAAEVTRIVRSVTDIPIIIKLSPNAMNIGAIAKACEDAGADAINMGNTLGPGLLINPEARVPILSNKFGGISGPAIKPIALKRVWDVYNAVSIPIIGTGGVNSGRDAVEMIMVGAVAVGVGTAVYEHGIEVFSKMNKEIKSFMEQNGYNSIKDMVGVAHR